MEQCVKIYKKDYFIKQVVFATAFTIFTSGVFLSGLALHMGASDVLVSYISIITNICGASILFFSTIMERFRSFKKIAITLTVCSKLSTLLIVLIPFFVPLKAHIAVFIPIMILAFTLQAQTTVIINNWMVTFIDEKQSGRYIARRQTFVLAVTVILSLVGGAFLDKISGAYIGFVILFLVAFAMTIIELIVLLRIPDAEQHTFVSKKMRFLDIIRIPMKNKAFLHFVVYIFLFYLMLTISDSFTVVYMMRYLELPYTTTTAMQMLISLPQIFLLGMWGKIADKKGHQFTLKLSIWFFIGETFFMALSNPQNLYLCIPIAFLFAALANAGFVISAFNRRYQLMPKEGRILYDNFYTAFIGVSFVLGPLIGGTIKGLVESNAWIDSILQFGNIRILYSISTLALIVLQIIYRTSRHQKTESM